MAHWLAATSGHSDALSRDGFSVCFVTVFHAAVDCDNGETANLQTDRLASSKCTP